jgi:hypothetical protein
VVNVQSRTKLFATIRRRISTRGKNSDPVE